MPTLAVNAVDLSFHRKGVPIFEDVSFAIPKGTYLGIIGPNGSGKSTLLQLLLGLIPPTKGRITLFGKSPEQAVREKTIRYVPQRGGRIDPLFPATVEEVVRSGSPSRGLLSSDEIDEALTLVDLLSYKKRSITHLSGGERQRALLARSLASRPDLLCLDEPTDGLDPDTRTIFYRALKSLNKLGTTIVLVSHDIERITKEVDAAVCLKHQEICEHDACLLHGPQLKAVFHKDRAEMLSGHTRHSPRV